MWSFVTAVLLSLDAKESDDDKESIVTWFPWEVVRAIPQTICPTVPPLTVTRRSVKPTWDMGQVKMIVLVPSLPR